MAQVPGIPELLPPLADYPPESARSSLPLVQWQAYLDSWLFSLEFRLRLSDEDFERSKMSQPSSGIQFLVSYCQNHPQVKNLTASPKEAQVHRRAYLLLRRLLLGTDTIHDLEPIMLINYLLLADGPFHRVSDWPQTLNSLSQRDPSILSLGLKDWKTYMMRRFNVSRESSGVSRDLKHMSSLVQVVPEAGLALMTGSDYLESLIGAYQKDKISLQDTKLTQQVLTEHLYRGLRSLMSDQTKHSSLLLDHLYLLMTETDLLQKGHSTQQGNILSSLLCTTAFLRHLARDVSIAETKRGRGLIDTLSAYREQTRHLHPPPPVRKHREPKGKGKAKETEDIHVHKAAQISQIHDLFPDISNSYVLRLLDHFDNDVEKVIAALLEPESLPPELRTPDADATIAIETIEQQPDLAPRPTPPLLPERRNVFDNDEFDQLKISSRQLHRGRKDLSMHEPVTKDEHARSKAAIMAALAAFDSDDDERDDTYDVADVGGTVDQSVDTDSRPRGERPPEQNLNEEVLFRAWKGNSELFARDSKTRISIGRQDLKRQTGMTDEQIEGWAIMLGRDKVLHGRLEKKYAEISTFRGNQRLVEQTKWHQNSSREASADESEGQAGDNASDGRRMGQAQIRGARNWGRGRGGSTAGPSDDPATQAARRRKEQGRGRGGGRSRWEGRARKMGRGMAGPMGQ